MMTNAATTIKALMRNTVCRPALDASSPKAGLGDRNSQIKESRVSAHCQATALRRHVGIAVVMARC
jgi:hypothetical protein